MKKLVSIVLCLCMIFAVACMTAGCGNDEMLKRMDDLQAALQTQSGKMDELQNQNTNLTEKIEDVTTQNSQLSGKLEDVTAQNSQLTEKLDEIQTQNTQLADKLEEQQAVIENQTAIIEFLKYKALQGVFLTVSEAYENGFISLENLKSIVYYYNVSKNRDGRYANEEIMPEDYSPTPKKPESLTRFTENAIKQKFLEKYLKSYNYITLDDIGVVYFGTYNKCVAVIVWCSGMAYGLAEDDINVGGVHFLYSNVNRVLIWVKE